MSSLTTATIETPPRGPYGYSDTEENLEEDVNCDDNGGPTFEEALSAVTELCIYCKHPIES